MNNQQHERPSAETNEASHGPNGQHPGTPAPRAGAVDSQLRNTLKGGPEREARASMERATAVVGDDEGDAS